jgi:beta-1,4-mannosyl-glycoprotein beta-1,4-N-acetylglucosaminyltransferase
MIYDCFGFFNELELLELRLHELGSVVDKFVLVEATKTHSNKPKPLCYQENRSKFSEFQDKIIHVIVNDLPDSQDAFLLDNYQRKCIERGLVNCRPDDWILISDLDEIPRAAVVDKLSREIPFHDNFLANAVHGALSSKLTQKIFHRRGLRRQLRKNHPYIWRFEQQQYVHFLNARTPTISLGTRMLRYRDFTCAEEMRYSGYKTVKDAGWHFTWMGGVDRIRLKLAAYAHQDLNQPQYNNPEVIADHLNRGLIMWADQEEPLEFVALDDSFPQYLRQRPEKFSHLLNLSAPTLKPN